MWEGAYALIEFSNRGIHDFPPELWPKPQMTWEEIKEAHSKHIRGLNNVPSVATEQPVHNLLLSPIEHVKHTSKSQKVYSKRNRPSHKNELYGRCVMPNAQANMHPYNIQQSNIVSIQDRNSYISQSTNNQQRLQSTTKHYPNMNGNGIYMRDCYDRPLYNNVQSNPLPMSDFNHIDRESPIHQNIEHSPSYHNVQSNGLPMSDMNNFDRESPIQQNFIQSPTYNNVQSNVLPMSDLNHFDRESPIQQHFVQTPGYNNVQSNMQHMSDLNNYDRQSPIQQHFVQSPTYMPYIVGNEENQFPRNIQMQMVWSSTPRSSQNVHPHPMDSPQFPQKRYKL